jgi:uncharacterized protein
MDFTNQFTVNAPLSAVWELLLNVEEVAPCVPGAELTEVVDETHYKGTVKVKLGAAQVSYRGEAELRVDEDRHTISLQARGTEARGSGGASGTVTSRLTEVSAGVTQVDIDSHIDVSGRVAQFGRGIMQDVANRLMRDFSNCLEKKLTDSASSNTETTAAGPTSAPAETSSSDVESAESQGDQVTGLVPAQPSVAAGDIKVVDLLVEAARGRIAAGLRTLATLIEPK